MGRYCSFKSCKSDTRSSTSKTLKFFRIPKPGRNNKNIEITKAWVQAINRSSITVNTIKDHHCVCSKHFVCDEGPTNKYPNPIRDPETDANSHPADSNDHLTVNKSSVTSYSKTPNASNSSGCSATATSSSLENNLRALASVTTENEMQINIKDEPMDSSAVALSNLNEDRRMLKPHSPLSSEPNLNDMQELNLETLKLEFFKQSNFLSWIVIFEKRRLTLARKKEDIFDTKVVISQDMTVDLYIYDKLIDKNNKKQISNPLIYSGKRINSVQEVLDCLAELQDWTSCKGISGSMFNTLNDSHHESGYFCLNSRSLRSKKCQLLFKGKTRTGACQNCGLFRKILRQKLNRRKKMVLKKKINIRYLNVEQSREKNNLNKRKTLHLLRRNKALEKKS